MKTKPLTRFFDAHLSVHPGALTLPFFFQISEHIERLVQLLHGDEPKITNADDELEELNSVPETQMDVTKGSTAKPTEDYDEDFRIEEI